jgi:hypothetical protein
MSEHNLAPAMDDMELISLYINEQLPEEQMEQLRERLATDEQFRYLAEPMMFATAILRQQMTKPRPAGELEKHWDEFTKRAGFEHQKKRTKTRRLWMLSILLAVVALSGVLARGRIQGAYSDWRDYAPVPSDTGWIRLRDNIEVRLQDGARLRNAKTLRPNSQKARLAGSARFRVTMGDAAVPVMVETRGGVLMLALGEATVHARGDTTLIEIHHPVSMFSYPPLAAITPEMNAAPTPLKGGDRYRLVTGKSPERIE